MFFSFFSGSKTGDNSAAFWPVSMQPRGLTVQLHARVFVNQYSTKVSITVVVVAVCALVVVFLGDVVNFL